MRILNKMLGVRSVVNNIVNLKHGIYFTKCSFQPQQLGKTNNPTEKHAVLSDSPSLLREQANPVRLSRVIYQPFPFLGSSWENPIFAV